MCPILLSQSIVAHPFSGMPEIIYEHYKQHSVQRLNAFGSESIEAVVRLNWAESR